MTKKNESRETAAVKKARERLEKKALDETGSTGRVVEDRREPHGVRVDLRIPVDEIREGGLRVKERLPKDWLTGLLADPAEEPWTAADDADIDVTLTRDAQTVRVRGDGHFVLAHTCVRCLEPVPFDLDLDLDLRLVPAGIEEDLSEEFALDYGLAEALDEAAESIDLSTGDEAVFDGRTVDLGAVLREQLFLELPMHPSCESDGAHPEGPCQLDREGALAQEQERWIDPRWAGLMALKDRLQS